ncbi:hypothetical protein CBR_g47112 [Chara braunii]|uniref:Integrase catalytic domain-containing protein n=1 Tax=Chara braunii TaxID=69332 RepID=A0A388M1R4_CHABU|nr:hypothetical protein CBR_g47112 [Chara braunii]|eukprot:GBG88413.1 hypothetical protein CBR_g47112 [Chara braunii]
MGGCHKMLCRHKVTKDNFRDRGTVKDMVRGEMEEEEMTMEEEDLEEEEMVDKTFVEEDQWGERNEEWMKELALAETYRLTDDPVTIEAGKKQVDQHLVTIGRVHYLVNSLLQVQVKNEEEIVKADEIVLGDDFKFDEELKEEEFEQGKISEDFREEEYDGFHLEMRLLLSGDKREREVSNKTLRMRDHYIVRGDHLFIRDKRGPPRRVICGRNRQIDVIAALHDGPVGDHRSFATTIKKVTELYFWEGMYGMSLKYCESCVPCQIRSPIRCKEPLHPRYIKDVGAVIHLDLLAMSLGLEDYNYIFDARDNLTGFVDGKVIQTKTGVILVECIKEYYLRYPFIVEFTMERGSEFTCGEVKELLDDLGVIVKYTTRAHPQANAPVERGPNMITNLLAKWTTGKSNLWPKFLRTVFFVENITAKRTTSYAPATLWYGRHAMFPIESFLKTWRRQDLENDMPLEELLDIRFRQDNLRVFLREFEEYAFRREWDTQTMLQQVAGLGECNEATYEIASDCLGWLDFKADMWAKYGDFTRDEIGDDIIFDSTNLEDFEDSINLCSEKRRWGERKKMKQVLRRIALREYEAVKKVREESDTWGSFLVKMRKQGNDEVRAQDGGNSIREDKTREEEHSEKKVEGSDKTGEEKKGNEKVKERKGKEKNNEKVEEAGSSGTAEVPTSNELRARGERRDMEWTKVKNEMVGLKVEMKKTKIEQGKLEVKVEAIGKLEARVSEQDKAIEAEKNERKQESEKLENRWKEVKEVLKRQKRDIQAKIEEGDAKKVEDKKENSRMEGGEKGLEDNSQYRGLMVGIVTLPEKDAGEISLVDYRVGQDRKRSYLEILIGAASHDIPSFAKRSKEEEKKLCWYCMKGIDRRDDCPGFKTDRAKGLVGLDENNRLVDRRGNLIKRTKEAFRVQLYEQLGLILED